MDTHTPGHTLLPSTPAKLYNSQDYLIPPPSTPLKNSGTLSMSGQYGSLSKQEQRKMVLESHSKDIGVLVLHTIFLNGLSDEADPYLVIESGDWKYITERRDSSPDPRWNCWFSFPFNGLGPMLKFTLMDHGFWGDESEAFFQFDTNELRHEATPQSDAIRAGHFTVGKDRIVSFFIDFKYQAWPAAFPLEDKNSKGNKAERQHELEKPEAFMRAVHFAISLQIQKWIPITCDSIPIPVTPKGTRLSTVSSLDDYFFVLEEDLDVPIPPEAGILIKLINMLPFDDESIQFLSRQEAIEYVHRVFGGLIIDPTEGTWGELTSDEAMFRYCFYNNGAVFMEKTKTGYKCDVEWLHQFKMRPGYFAYGGAAYFDEKGKLTHLTYDGKTFKPDGSKHWEFMKLVVRSTIFICAAGIHLMQGHLTWSNYPNYAMRKALSPEHCIRRFLHVHFWRSAMVCSKSLQSLVPERGLLHRGTGFEIDGLHDFYRYALDNYKFETFPDDLKARGMDSAPPEIYPTTNDGMLFYNMILEYVSAYIDIHYKNDNAVTSDQELVEFWAVCEERLTQPCRKYQAKDAKTFPKLTLANLKIVITEFVFRVTAWHQNIGNALAPINDPCTIALRLIEGQPISSVQSLYVQGLVTMLTSMRMPTMSSNGSWIHMFRGDKEVKVYNDFRDAMNELSSKIIKLNRKRGEGKGYKIVDYDPRYTCVSVSS